MPRIGPDTVSPVNTRPNIVMVLLNGMLAMQHPVVTVLVHLYEMIDLHTGEHTHIGPNGTQTVQI